jgi:hypothetical protein
MSSTIAMSPPTSCAVIMLGVCELRSVRPGCPQFGAGSPHDAVAGFAISVSIIDHAVTHFLKRDAGEGAAFAGGRQFTISARRK